MPVQVVLIEGVDPLDVLGPVEVGREIDPSVAHAGERVVRPGRRGTVRRPAGVAVAAP